MDLNDVVIRHERTGTTLSVHFTGELDAANVEGLSDRVLPLLERTDQQMVLDLSGVTFCGSAGLSLFIRLHNAARAQGGDLVICSPADAVLRTIRLCRLDDILTVVPALPAPT